MEDIEIKDKRSNHGYHPDNFQDGIRLADFPSFQNLESLSNRENERYYMTNRGLYSRFFQTHHPTVKTVGNSPFFKILNLLLLTTTLTFAQINTSVQTVVQVLPPYTLTLSDYTSTDMDKLHVALFFNDPTLSSVEVKLRIRIESDKLTLITKPEYIPPKLILEERDWLNLTGADLADYFKPENLNISGSLQQGRLPEGLYRFCIEVLEYKRGVSLSNMTCSAPVWMVLNDPPIWQLPRRNETVEATFPQNLLFNWLPRHTGSPNSLFEVEYELHVEPIYNENVNLQALPLIQNTFQAIETDFPSYIMNGGDVLQLEPGQKYAAWVKAKDKSGKDLFRNNGVSEVIMFTFGQKCETPSDPSIVTLSYKQANLSWTGNANNNEYTLSYHEKGQDNNTWYGPKSLYLTSYQLNDLKSNTQYEVKLKAACNTLESEETSLISFTTPTPPVEDFNCNDPHAKPRLAKTKKKSLSVGDVILLRGANLKIVEVTGGDGVFSGKGILTPLSLAMLQKIGLEATFSNIGVNEDNKLTDGVVQVISGPVKVIDKEAQENVSKLISSLQLANDDAANQKVVADVEELLANSPKLPVFAKALITQGKDQIAQGQAMVAAGNTEEGQKQIAQGKLTLQKGLDKASLAFSGSGGIVSLDAKAKTIASDANATIVFSKAENTQYGYDTFKEPLLKSKYEKVIDETGKKEIYPDWKALESGKPDYVNVQINATGTYKADSVKFETENGLTLAKAGSSLTLIGGTDGSDTRIYATYKIGKDERRLAQLNTASYDKVENKVYLIPLNGTTIDAQQIQTALNQIYKQAVASFKVEAKPSFTLPAEIGSIEVGNSSLLSTYTDDMQKIIKAYKAANNDYDKDNYYLFVGGTPSDASQLGYMPRAKNFGFIFSTDLSDKTIAHELGHGVFHLKHTFAETSVPKSSSQNLMDYAKGTFLNKYQWDYVHNPAFVVGLFEGDKAGAFKNISSTHIKELIILIKRNYAESKNISGNDLLSVSNTFNNKDSGMLNDYKIGSISIAKIDFKNQPININLSLNPKSIVKLQGSHEEHFQKVTDYQIVIDQAFTFILATEAEQNALYSYLTNTDISNIILFVNGYRNKFELSRPFESLQTDYPRHGDNVSSQDIDDYWVGKDIQFMDAIGNYNAYYADGHDDITTSNHVVNNEIQASKLSVLKNVTQANMVKNEVGNACYQVESCLTLHNTPNVAGFNKRYTNGIQAGKSLWVKIDKGEIKIQKNAKGEITGKIDIVVHSMGFAYSLGMISELKKHLATESKFGRFYIVAPENGCSGSVTPTDFEEVWQYGSNETGEKNYNQDGIAPQCAVGGLKIENRVPYPSDGTVPRGFLESHSVENYGWIFTTLNGDEKGVVKKR